jgi:CO/xanthine dehydrogenase FAD-binding subunit
MERPQCPQRIGARVAAVRTPSWVAHELALMKPAAFEYLQPRSLGEAIATLGRYGGEAKLLAGGQSLVPLLNFRLLRPAALVDINRIAGLDRLDWRADAGLRIGALTRHHALETSSMVARHFPVISAAMAHVAHLAIRNRGTLGGSLAHADPAAELAMLALLLDAEIVSESVRGSRVLPAKAFLVGALLTALADDEMITEVRFPPLPPGSGWDFREFAQRRGDFAIAAAGVILALREGRVTQARLALMGVGETAVRASEAEALLLGERCQPAVVSAAAARARAAISPHSDLRASADYRRHLVGVLVEQGLIAAFARAERETP